MGTMTKRNSTYTLSPIKLKDDLPGKLRDLMKWYRGSRAYVVRHAIDMLHRCGPPNPEARGGQ